MRNGARQLTAVIVLKDRANVSAEALQQYCKERLSSYKVPKSVLFVPSLPHTEVGKVNKVKVREMLINETVALGLDRPSGSFDR